MAFTVIAQVAVFVTPETVDIAEIVAVPVLFAVTRPELLTVATFELLDVHVTPELWFVES
jgi:hypothetical protein